MKTRKLLTVVFAAGMILALTGAAQAGMFKIDLSDDLGSATNWDVFTADVTDTGITDWSGGGDNDVTLSITGMFGESVTGAPGTSATVDGVTVPKEARDDYVWGGTNNPPNYIVFEFKNLDPGPYNVSVFEGRTDDGNGQFGTIWVGEFGDKPGATNTGNFAGSSATITDLTISTGDSLYYSHYEDGTGGTSGLIVREVPEPATLMLIAVGVPFVLKRSRR
ncbi:MAG: PEP-CTERM sorting domain-containing protein [Phycisphaerae bacterium]|nr:PEP-CTERM sorting domain-containing protein [Phycisphaerae bacterium]